MRYKCYKPIQSNIDQERSQTSIFIFGKKLNKKKEY